MRKFNFKEYRELKKSNIPYLVKVDPMIVDRGVHHIYLFKATDEQSIRSIENIFGNYTVTYPIHHSDDILREMASGVVYGVNFMIT